MVKAQREQMEEVMSKRKPRNTVATALAAPETTTSERLGTFKTLEAAIVFVHQTVVVRAIRAVGITSLVHIHAKMQPDWRPLIADDSFAKFVHWFYPYYHPYRNFEVRLEEVPQVSEHGSAVHEPMMVIICMNEGEKLEDITGIKEH